MLLKFFLPKYLWKQLECQLYKVERVLVLYLVRFSLHYLVHLQHAWMLGIKYYANSSIIEIYRAILLKFYQG